MNELRFSGKIVNGFGKHAELVVPGKSALPEAPTDWPEKLFPGSLNLLVTEFPFEFASRGLPTSAKVLDTAGFAPEFTIRQELMLNNKLKVTPTMPHRGTAQIWRASLEAADQRASCWVLRRFGSGLSNQIELVSVESLRELMGLLREQEWPATVTMFGRW